MTEQFTVLTPQQGHAVLAEAALGTPEEWALVELALRAGLRGQEILDATVPAARPPGCPARAMVESRLRSRVVELAATTTRAVEAQASAVGAEPGHPLFPGMSVPRLVQRIQGVCRDADAPVRIHALRMTAIGTALDHEIALIDVQAYFGFFIDGVLPAVRPGAGVRIADVLERAFAPALSS